MNNIIIIVPTLNEKKNIEDLTAGVDFINKLQPRRFVWNMRDGGKIDIPDYGFIAQELLSAQKGGYEWLKLVNDLDSNRLLATPGKLIPVLVHAIKELSNKCTELENGIKYIHSTYALSKRESRRRRELSEEQARLRKLEQS